MTMMKTLSLTCLCSALFFTACEKAKELATFDKDVPYSYALEFPNNTGIPASTPIPGGFPLSYNFAYETKAQQYIKDFHTSRDNVIHVKLKNLTMQLIQPTGANFNFTDSIKLYVTGTGLPDLLVAYRIPMPINETNVEMNVVDANIKEYFLQDSLHVRLNATINATPPAGARVNLNTNCTLRANPLY